MVVTDADGQITCAANESLPVESDPPADVYVEVQCPQGRIHNGLPPGDLIVFAETLAESAVWGEDGLSSYPELP